MQDSVNLTSKTLLKTNSILTNSMCLLRDKKQNKMFIAQTKGIHIYESQTQNFFDVKLSDSNSGVVSCLTLSDDLVFFCFGMRIYACANNGRTLFEADTYLAVDKIDSIHVYGYQLWIVAGNMMNEFLIGGAQLSNKISRITPPPQQKIQDVNSNIFDVKINHALLIKNDGEKPFLLILKNNNQIEIGQKKDNTIFTTDSPPTYAYLYPTEQNTSKVLIGTMEGEILYLQVERKKIKKLWSIKQGSKGRINCIVQVKNGFIIFREGCYQMWNTNRQCLGKQKVEDKIQSAVYNPDFQSFYYGTMGGLVVEMYNYQKMMKYARERNQIAERTKLIKEIEDLRRAKAELKLAVDKLGATKEIKTNNTLKVQTNLSIDYVRLCYILEINCDRPIIKVIVRGNISLFDQTEGLQFQGIQNENNKVYSLRGDQRKLFSLRFKYQEKYQQNDKLVCSVFADVEGRLLTFVNNVDLKYLFLHQKIESKLLDKVNAKVNTLKIEGEFKYFLMSTWLSGIFNDFGTPQPSDIGEYIECCYQSLVNKNKLYLQYRDRQCCFYSQSPTPLNIIKKAIFEKSKVKSLSLSYETKTNIEGVSNLLKKLAPKLKKYQQNKKQYELLPGIQQIQQENISGQLQSILARGQEIKKRFMEGERQNSEIKNSIKQFYTNYRILNNWEILPFQLQELSKNLQNFNPQKIIKLIQN